MRIVLDAKRAYHNHRGLGNYSRDVIRLLTNYGPDEEYVLFARPTDTYTFPHTSTIAPEGLWKLAPSLWRSFGCLRALKNTDLYWGLSGELPFGIHQCGVKTIVTIHDLLVFRYPHLYSPGYRKLFAAKMSYATRVADKIIAISEQTKRDIITYLQADERKISVVYQGCSRIFHEPVTAQKIAQVRAAYSLPQEYILYVGALEERKNLHTLIEALAEAQVTLPLVLVGGESAYGRELQQQASRLGVAIQILSGVPQADLPAIYKEAALFVYPSIFEGFGIPILEALTVGTPVLTSTGGCFAEVGGEAALYADPAKPEEIATQIVKILSDPSLREQMTAHGHEQAEKFTDERVAANLLRVVQSVKVLSR